MRQDETSLPVSPAAPDPEPHSNDKNRDHPKKHAMSRQPKLSIGDKLPMPQADVNLESQKKSVLQRGEINENKGHTGLSPYFLLRIHYAPQSIPGSLTETHSQWLMALSPSSRSWICDSVTVSSRRVEKS